MSEEQEGGMSTVKKTIIGVATTAVTAVGAYVTTHIEAIFGGDEEEKVEQVAAPAQPAAAPIVLNIDNSSQNNSSNSGGGGTNTIIKETVREVPAAQPAAPVEEPKETNAERMARLKAKRAEQNGGGAE
jgi:hypothetical protein